MKKFYLNKQDNKIAKKLGYPIDVIAKRKPKNSIKLGKTSGFVRYAYGGKNYLVPRKGWKLIRR